MSVDRTWPPLEFRVSVSAPRPEVWRAFTEPELLVRWLAREARGSAVQEQHLMLGWPEMAIECRIVLATFERVLRFSWPDPAGILPDTMVVVFLHARDDRTLVDLQHYGFGRGHEWDARYVSYSSAWSGYLKNLKSVLGGGPDLREDDE